jgi:hypothetical protein
MSENHKNIKLVVARQNTRSNQERLREDSNGAARDKTPAKAS